MANKLNNVATSFFDRTATWLNFSNKVWTLMPRNGVSNPKLSEGGLVGQRSAFGSWQLKDDEALVLTTHALGAPYQGIELGSRWFVSLDYEYRSSTLTEDQSYQSSDGTYHYVISARDPGIQNWLDTENHESGLIMMRWQGLSEKIADHLKPTAKLVKFDQLREVLPDSIPVFTAEQRREQIKERSKNVQERFQG